MNHVALDRPRPDNGDFDDQVIEFFRPQARQHGHLRTRLDLKHADGVGAADHFVGFPVVARQVCEGPALAPVQMHQIERAAQGAEHAQCKYVDFQQADQVQIILVPLNDRAVGHRGVLDRHQRLQRMLGNHEAARMLRQMPRKADQLAGECQHTLEDWHVGIEAVFAQAFGRRQRIAPAAEGIGQGVDLVRRQTQHLGHITHCARAVIRAGHRRQRRPAPTITPEYVLNDFFAAVVLEIHVDIRWLVALFGDEALEQQVTLFRVQLGDPQRITHCRVGRRATSLAKDMLAAGKLDDVMHGQKVAVELLFRDQGQFLLDLRAGGWRQPVRPAFAGTALGQFTQPRRGCLAFGDQLVRVFIFQLFEIKRAAPGNTHRFGQQPVRVMLGKRIQWP
ncbi:Titin [Pseudomonas amygdali pv. photiniae]|uniref:Titin n=1 Tax=Pseudomonas amygdali pv. photiniae TaxID=251724 RepID=A0A0P9ULU6_PSEA0|nr:Titin [Pseudomonas amygdali pv. photiniae]